MRFLICILLLAVLSACSSTPSVGSPEYIREQVYQCRSLCANSEVNLAKIQGLDCVCSKPQIPVIYTPIINGASVAPTGARSAEVATTATEELTPSGSGVSFVNTQGRTVYSQTR